MADWTPAEPPVNTGRLPGTNPANFLQRRLANFRFADDQPGNRLRSPRSPFRANFRIATWTRSPASIGAVNRTSAFPRERWRDTRVISPVPLLYE